MLLGNIIGLNANIVFPDWLILFIFVIVLATNLSSCIKKYKEIVKNQKNDKVEVLKDTYKDKGNINIEMAECFQENIKSNTSVSTLDTIQKITTVNNLKDLTYNDE